MKMGLLIFLPNLGHSETHYKTCTNLLRHSINALHYIALHCIVLHCIALYCIALHCIAMMSQSNVSGAGLLSSQITHHKIGQLANQNSRGTRRFSEG